MSEYRAICKHCHESKPAGRYDTSKYCSDICEIADLKSQLAQAKAENEWIPVTPENMPEFIGEYQAIDSVTGYDILFYDGSRWCYSDCTPLPEKNQSCITHYKPIILPKT